MSTAFDIHPERAAALYAIRDQYPGTEGKTQVLRLFVAILTLGHVTTFECSRYLDIYHPPARKLDLVKAGYRILMIWRLVVTESGDKHRVGVYLMDRSTPDTPDHEPAANDPAKEKASDATRTPKAFKNANLDCAAQADFTPEAAASALQVGLDAANRALLMLGGANPHASLIAVSEAIKALGAAADSLKVLIGL